MSENLYVLVQLLKDEYVVKAVRNGKEALQIAAEKPPDLMLLDILMPEMDGFTVCEKLKENAATSKFPVLFISALSDHLDIVKAFEVGGVDYIIKPFQECEVRARVKAHLDLYLAKKELQTLLSKTLTGSIKMLIDLLTVTQPAVMAQTKRFSRYASKIAKKMELSTQEAWMIELAVLLSSVGYLGIPQDILKKSHSKQTLSNIESKKLREYAAIGADMISKIPRLERISMMIRNQITPLDELVADENDIVYLGSVILNMLLTFDKLVDSGTEPLKAVNILREVAYPPRLLDIFKSIIYTDSLCKLQRIPFELLEPGMILDEDIIGWDGNLLISKGSELSDNLIRLLQNLYQRGDCSIQDVRIKMPSIDR